MIIIGFSSIMIVVFKYSKTIKISTGTSSSLKIAKSWGQKNGRRRETMRMVLMKPKKKT